jgi:2-C-methyl-D-erythritol 4-phosphate cytidylyltransferase
MLLNFSSSSYTRGRSGYVPYSACKAAVVNLTQGLAEEWRDEGIRVNCIVPGRTDTAMRRINFYNEDQDSLLSPYEVALTATKVLNANYSGMVVRV